MAVVKSELLKQFSNNYPNFLKRDLNKLVSIFLSEIKNSLKRHERVELRGIFSLEPRFHKGRMGRNPRTNTKVYVKDKHSILFKSSKKWLQIINNGK